MESSGPESSVTNRKMAVEELIRGREFAARLSSMLREPLKGDASVFAGELAAKILGSFSETISILNSSETDETSQVPTNTRLSLRCSSDGWKFEDSSESCQNTEVKKDRRGCYKRRKTSQTWTRESPTWLDDGHAWRKYGQKVIFNAKYPRNYFRCTHKYDQGCKATKQVQRVQEDPPIYRTIYNGHHTCKHLPKAPKINLDSTARDSSSFLRNFESNDPNDEPNDSVFPAFSSIKQEYMGEISTLNNNQPSSSYYFLSPDLTTFEASDPMAAMSSGSDYGDVISPGVYSCTASTHSMEIGMRIGSVDFQDVLKYEF